jgi:ATP-dependent protease HslVU (ClpYQ) peptidase subunit
LTAIAAVVDGGKVWMGADSALSDMHTHELRIVTNQKIFKLGEMLLGVAGSPRVGDALRFQLVMPKHPKRMDAAKFLRTHFVDAMRDVLKKAGTLSLQFGVEEMDASVIIGYRGRLFVVEGDMHVHEWPTDYAAVGSGGAVACGALSVSSGVPGRKRLLAALSAAERFTISVRRPFYVLETGETVVDVSKKQE